MPVTGSIAELWRYPVKSMAGEQVGALRVDWRGAAGDRTHALHFEHKAALKRLTAREAAGLLRWGATYEAADPEPDDLPPVSLTAPDGRAFGWDDPALPVALGGHLDRQVVLQRDLTGQQDLGRSLLVTTEASRRALEAEVGESVDLRRFRTNLHLDLDAPAWSEERWEGGTIELDGGVVLRLLHPCVRCVIPTRHPDTTDRWPGLLKHLNAAHERLFGINARVEGPGRVVEGERVSVLPAPGSSA